MTITAEANEPRPPSAKKAMAYKHIGSRQCDDAYGEAYMTPGVCTPFDTIKQWNVDVIQADPDRCGLAGSPTKVKKVQNVVLTTGDARRIPNTDTDIAGLMQELIQENIIG
jgi:electron transfer flavoprotein beta subunit